MTRVLISAPYFQPVLERFRHRFDERGIELVVPPVEERLEEPELLRLIPGIDGVVCGDDRFTAKVIAAADTLKVISKWGTGVDSIDADACAARGIALCRTPNAFSEPVADSVLGYALAFARNQPALDRAMKGGEWQKVPGASLGELTFGIIGVGDVGTAVAKRVVGFGSELLGTDITPIRQEALDYGLEPAELEDLLARSDIIAVCCDLNPTSRHIIRAERLALMKPGAVVINAARGPLVCEPDLVAALQNGTIRGAAMDVFEDEPLPLDSPLRTMDHVMLAPHNANSSPRAWEKVHENTLANLFRELERHGV
ncbi:MAG: D-3-phosphoglycerate dehydrogenase [Bradymonadia bacterium]|jgi:D-3-phosphoglycerate dehydrogenase